MRQKGTLSSQIQAFGKEVRGTLFQAGKDSKLFCNGTAKFRGED
jgi:hypothetical protein